MIGKGFRKLRIGIIVLTWILMCSSVVFAQEPSAPFFGRSSLSPAAFFYEYPVIGIGAICVFVGLLVIIFIQRWKYRTNLKWQQNQTHITEIDEKTGLYNKTAFYGKVQALLKENPNESFLLLRWDIDRFKVYNDIFGVKEGDRILEQIGTYPKPYPTMPHAHLDADHFICCIPANLFDEDKMLAYLETMLNSFTSSFHFTVRMGAYLIQDPSLDMNLMCDCALCALRSTKGDMVHRFAWFVPAMREKNTKEQATLSQIISALENDEFIIYLHPQYDQYTNTVVAAEALIRWAHPKRGVLPPGEFIEIMEKNGLISKLDFAVADKVAAMLARMIAEGKPVVPISINISRYDLYNPELCATLCAVTEKYGIDRHLLRLEITESAYMTNPEQMILIVKNLRDRGFYIEMDDFGSGYSSLNMLKDMPVDVLKLDMKFLSASDHSTAGGIILSSVIRMSHWLGLRTIAEGVETVQQADYLKTLGCRYIQGYLYARPMPVTAFEHLLSTCEHSTLAPEMVVESYFNGSDFWNPHSQATVIFNTLVGAAGIFEYCEGNLECVRLNDKFFEEMESSRKSPDLLRDKVLDWIWEDDRTVVQEVLSNAANSTKEFEFECRWMNVDPDDEPRWLHIRARRIAKNIDRVIFYFGITNITKRKSMELRERKMVEELRTENESNQALMARTGLCFFQYDVCMDELVYQYSEPGHPIIRHTLPHFLCALTETGLIYPSDCENVASCFRAAVTEKSGGSLECRVCTGESEEYYWQRVYYNPIANECGETVRVIGQFENIHEEKEREIQLEELDRRLGSLSLYDPAVTGHIFQHLYETTDVKQGIRDVLEILGEYFHVSRVYIIEDAPDCLSCSNTFEWCAPGITPQLTALQQVQYDTIGGREAYIANFAENGVFLLENIAEAPPSLRHILEPQGIISMFQCAMYDDGEFFGYIGFDECSDSTRSWSPTLMGTLTLVSHTIGVFLSKRRKSGDAEFSIDFREAIDKNSAYIYFADPCTYEIHYSNQAVHALLHDTFTGQLCYKSLLGRSAPCTSCPMQLYEQAGLPHAIEICRPDNMWVLCQASPIRWNGHNLMMVICIDITAQKQTAEAIRISEDELRLSREQTGKIICRYDIETQTMLLPDNYAKSQGIPKELAPLPQMLITQFNMDMADQNTIDYIAFFDAIHRGEKHGESEVEFITSNGASRWFFMSFTSIFSNEGKPVRAVIALEERTEQHERQRSRTLDRERLYAAVQSTYPLALAINLTKSTYAIITKEGYPIQKIPQEGSYDKLVCGTAALIHEQNRKEFLTLFTRAKMIEALMSTSQGVRYEVLQLCDDNAWHWLEMLVYAVENPYDNDVLGVILARPIDEQKALEQQLQTALAHTSGELEKERFNLELISTNMIAEMIIYLIKENRISHMSGMLLKTFGYSDEEIGNFQRNDLRGLIPDPDFAKVHAAFLKDVQECLPYMELEFHAKKKDGSTAWVLTRFTLTRSREGEPVYVGVMMDISERKEIEDQLRTSERFLRLVSKLSDRIVYSYDPFSSRAVAIDPVRSENNGLPAVYDTIPESALTRTMPESIEESRRFFAALKAGQPNGYARLRLKTERSGEARWFDVRFITAQDKAGGVISYLDINDIHDKELAYTRYLSSTRASSSYGVMYIEADLTADIVEKTSGRLFPSQLDLVGWNCRRAVESIVFHYFPEEARESALAYFSRENLIALAKQHDAITSEVYPIHSSDGTNHWVQVSFQFVTDPYSGNLKAYTTVKDVTEQTLQNLDIQYRAQIDGMTDIYNRKTTEHLIRTLLAGEAGIRCLLLQIDLDNLKTINDTWGHAEGDRALKEIAAQLKANFRATDIIGRVGGDEYMVLLQNVSNQEAISNSLNTLFSRVAALRVGPSNEASISISVGAAFGITGEIDFDTLYRQADRALYVVKRSGKNNYAFYHPKMEE